MTNNLWETAESRTGTAIRLAQLALASAVVLTAAGCATMPNPPSAQAVIAAKFDAVNRHAVSEIENLYAADAVVSSPDFCTPRVGRLEVRRNYEHLFAAYPDIRTDVSEYVVQGEKVAVRLNIRGHVQGQAFDVPTFDFFTVRNGLITSDDGLFDAKGRKCTP